MVGAGIFHKGYCLFKKLIAKSNEYDRTFDPGRTAALKASLPTPEYQQRTCSQPTKLYKGARPFLLCLQAPWAIDICKHWFVAICTVPPKNTA
ncbi:MAG TPA: hypothetical protein DCY55_07435 [Gammaproteobacteria bacterium]|nr:hypothetical protein [Gammaproteobacteria bacterium]